MVSSKRKVIYALPSELMNKQLEKSCDESERVVVVPNNYDIDFSDECDTRTINFVAPFELSIIQIGWKLYMLTLMLEMNQILNLYKIKEKKNVTSHKVHIYYQCGIHFK